MSELEKRISRLQYHREQERVRQELLRRQEADSPISKLAIVASEVAALAIRRTLPLDTILNNRTEIWRNSRNPFSSYVNNKVFVGFKDQPLVSGWRLHLQQKSWTGSAPYMGEAESLTYFEGTILKKDGRLQSFTTDSVVSDRKSSLVTKDGGMTIINVKTDPLTHQLSAQRLIEGIDDKKAEAMIDSLAAFAMDKRLID